MSDFTSEVRTIPHNDEKVFTMLSDMTNLERVKEKIPQDKIKNFTFDADTCSFTVDPVGAVTFQIIEREPNKTIKFTTVNSPVPLLMWIQLKQVADNDTKMKMTVRADLNPFFKTMVAKPLQDAVDKMSEIIANLPY
jgi:carbon monoxide dehydrogenase subunit G